MIIKISQTASNVRQSYDIEGENFYYTADAGSFSRLQPIILSGKDTTVKGVYTPSKWVNYIPFRYLFGRENLTRAFRLYKNGTAYGSIVHADRGFLKSLYVITSADGEVLQCYYLSRGAFDYVSVYSGDVQIALAETYLSVNDYMYTHKLYLSDAHARFADVLAFFVVYYASYRFAKRMHMSAGSVSTRSWSLSKYADKYDPAWRETHFPDENFFGKTSLTK